MEIIENEVNNNNINININNNKKKYYPFGTPNHGKIPFSNISHLSPENMMFAYQLANNNNDNNDKTIINNKYEKNKNNNFKKSPIISLPEPDLSTIEGMPESEKGIAPCIRQDCKEVIMSIIEIQNKNQIERDEIVTECEKMIQLHQQLEEESALLESDNKRMILEGNILELRMKTLSSKLAKSETTKSTLDHERDELNSKIMMMELEKQRTTRRSAEIQAALAEIMWKGSTTLLNDQQPKTSLYIKPYDLQSHQKADNPSPTSYRSLVDDHLLDFNERPKTVPLIPSELRLIKSMSLNDETFELTNNSRPFTQSSIHLNNTLIKSKSLHKTLHTLNQKDGTNLLSITNKINNQNDHGSVSELSTASHVIGNRNKIPLSKLKYRSNTLQTTQPLYAPNTTSTLSSKLHSTPSPITNSSTFKGYTPSGGRRTLNSNSIEKLNQTINEQFERDSVSSSCSIPGLDPVFYLERARNNWGREKKLGKIRLRNDPEGYRRKMLTSIGHPGVFGVDDKDDDRVLFKTL